MFEVVIAGIPRSGSTFLFNAARMAMKRRFASVQSAWIDDYADGRGCEAGVIKMHDCNNCWRTRADCVLLSHRDLRDIASSTKAMGWAHSDTDMIAAAESARAMHDFWSETADLDLPYDLIRAKPVAAVSAVASAVGVDLDDDDAESLSALIPFKPSNVGAGGYDRESLLHANHITNGKSGRWRDDLPGNVANAIWARHGDWLQAHGYRRS